MKTKFAKNLVDFFSERIWNADFKALRALKRALYSFCRLLVLAVRGFFEDQCTLQSSALTYITMVSLVPVLAVALAFCKGIGLQEQLLAHLGIETLVQQSPDGGEEVLVYRVVPKPVVETETETETEVSPEGEVIVAEVSHAEVVVAVEESEVLSQEKEGASVEALPEIAEGEGVEPSSLGAAESGQEALLPAGQIKPGFAAELPEPMQMALLNIFSYVDKTNFAALGVIGVLTLLSTAVMSIKKLEDNFNAIWCVKRGRTLLRQVSEYLVVLLLLPVILFSVLSLSAFVSSDNLAGLLHTNSSFIIYWGNFFAKLLLFGCLIACFAALYLFMPNTHVRLGPAFLAGAFSAILWGIVLLAYIKWQVGLAKYNAIYGTFAALPFFLAWLYTNWLVILLGGEICFAAQNQRLLRQTKQLRPVEAGASRMLGIAIVEAISRHYDDGKGCWNAGRYALDHNVSIRELEFALESLAKAGLVIQRKPDSDPPEAYEYILGRPASQITLSQVSDAFVGIDSATAHRIEKCLPPKFVEYMERHHRELDERLAKITFDHFATATPNVENPEA